MKNEMNPPNRGNEVKINYHGKVVDAEVFDVRDYGGFVKYALIRPPHTDHPSVKISVWRVR